MSNKNTDKTTEADQRLCCSHFVITWLLTKGITTLLPPLPVGAIAFMRLKK